MKTTSNYNTHRHSLFAQQMCRADQLAAFWHNRDQDLSKHLSPIFGKWYIRIQHNTHIPSYYWDNCVIFRYAIKNQMAFSERFT